MFQRLLPTLVWLAILSPASQAGVLFEPFVGYAVGKLEFTPNGNINPLLDGRSFSGSVNGFSYGGRLGMIYLPFILGAEYQVLNGVQKLDGSSESVNWNNTTVFGILGFEYMNLRLIGGMSVSHVSEEKDDVPGKYTGDAYKIGLGYKFAGMPVAINGEYIVYTMKKAQFDGGENLPISENFDAFKYSAMMFSLSFPFDLGGGGHRRR